MRKQEVEDEVYEEVLDGRASRSGRLAAHLPPPGWMWMSFVSVLEDTMLVLKAVETTASTVVELDITEVAKVVRVAVGTKTFNYSGLLSDEGIYVS